MTTSINRRIGAGLLAGWGGQIVMLVLRLLLTPVLFATMTKVEVGVWYLLGSTVSVLHLAEFGMTIALSRRIGMAKGRVDFSGNDALRDSGQAELSSLIAIGRVTFLWRALLALALGGVGGFIYIDTLALEPDVEQKAQLAWLILVLGHAIQIRFAFWGTVVSGLGLVAHGVMIATVSGMLTIIGQIAVVYGGGGLVGLAAVGILAPFIQRQLQVRHLRRNYPALVNDRGRFDPQLFRSMVKPAMLAWLTVLSTFALERIDNFFIASHLGLAAIADYQPMIQITGSLSGLAMSVSGASWFFYSQLWGAGKLPEIQAMVIRNLHMALIFLATGLGFLWGAHASIFRYWLGDQFHLNEDVLIVLMVKITIDAVVVTHLSVLRAIEKEKISLFIFLSALVKIPATIVGIDYIGLPGVVVSSIICQVAIVFVFVFVDTRKHIDLNIFSTLFRLAPEIGLLFAASLLAVRFISQDGPEVMGGYASLLIAGLVVALLLAGALYFRILSRHERARVRQMALRRIAGPGRRQ